MLRVVAAAIQDSDNRILVVQKGANSSYPFCWEFPGGKVRQGESDEEALIREIKEELNVDIEVMSLLRNVQGVIDERRISLYIFLCHLLGGEIKLTEHVDIQWASKHELKQLQFGPLDQEFVNSPEFLNN